MIQRNGEEHASSTEKSEPLLTRYEPLGVLGAVVLYLGYGLYRLGTTTFFVDEATRAFQASLPLALLLRELRADIHPPLYMLLQHEWQQMFGGGDVTLRSLSVLVSAAGLLTAYATWRLVGIPLRQRIFALLVLASSPCFVNYSRLAFSWPMFAALITLVVYCLLTVRIKRSVWGLIGLILSSTAALYTNYLAGVLGIGAALFWLVFRRRFASPLHWIAFWAIAAAALYSAWLPTFYQQWMAHLQDTSGVDLSARSAKLAPRIVSCCFQFVLGDSSNPASYGVMAFAAVIVAVCLFLALRSLRNPSVPDAARDYLLLQMLLFGFGLAAMTWLHGEQHYLFTAERLQFALPAFVVFLVLGVCRFRWPKALLGVVLACHALLYNNWLNETTYLNWAYHSHWDRYCERLAGSKHLDSSDGQTTVYFDNYAFGRIGERYCASLGPVVPILDATHTRANPTVIQDMATTGGQPIVWIQSHRDTSPQQTVTSLREQMRKKFSLAEKMYFLPEPFDWYQLKKRLGEGQTERFKILGVVMAAQEAITILEDTSGSNSRQ